MDPMSLSSVLLLTRFVLKTECTKWQKLFGLLASLGWEVENSPHLCFFPAALSTWFPTGISNSTLLLSQWTCFSSVCLYGDVLITSLIIQAWKISQHWPFLLFSLPLTKLSNSVKSIFATLLKLNPLPSYCHGPALGVYCCLLQWLLWCSDCAQM